MSHWHPTVDSAGLWRAHYERWSDVHGPRCDVTRRLRQSISAASRNERLTQMQRNELLALLVQIDDEGLGR